MKSFIDRLVFTLPVIPGSAGKFVQGTRKFCYAVIVIAGSISFSSCFHYYTANRVHRTDAETIQQLVNQGKYFIIHGGKDNFALNDLKLNNENLEASVVPLPPEHRTYLSPGNKNTIRFKEKNTADVLSEVHLYTREPITSDMRISLPVKDFYQMDVYELNEQATKKSKKRTTVALSLAGGGAVLLAIGIAQLNHDLNSVSYTPVTVSNSSNSAWCSPQVYALNGTDKQLAGILYSGAIFAPLQRTDYLPFTAIEKIHGAFHLQIRGGRNEEQIIHEAKLIAVTHDRDKKVLFDHCGKLLVYGEPVKPGKVFTGNIHDIKKDVSAADEKYYSFTNHSPGQSTSNIILDFKKPAGVHKAKLVIRAKNSPWASYVFKKYKSLYGDSYPALVERKDKADPKKLLQCELDQALPLLVSVKDGKNWKYIDFFYTPGNETLRDMIMEINLEDIQQTNHIQIKLETSYLFWDLDYAGMDFSENPSCQTNSIPANRISKISNGEVAYELDPAGNIHLSDKEYLNLDFVA